MENIMTVEDILKVSVFDVRVVITDRGRKSPLLLAISLLCT